MTTLMPAPLLRLQSLRNKVHDFQYWETASESVQRFLARDLLESERVVAFRRARADVLHRHHHNNTPVAGFISVDLDPFNETLSQRAIDEAVFAASLTTNPDFQLLGPGAGNYLPINLVDRVIKHQPAQALDLCETTLHEVLKKNSDVRLSSAELFTNHTQTVFQNSLGLQGFKEDTAMFLLFVFLYPHGGKEVEVEVEVKARCLEQLDLAGELTLALERARRAIRAELPQTGTSDVVLTGEPLESLWNWVIHQSSANGWFAKTASTSVGQSLAKGKVEGDFLNFYSDATHEFGMKSYTFDHFGQPAQRVQLVRGSVLQNRWADKKYADYLGVPPTGEFGMAIVDPGALSDSEIISSRDGKPVYLVEQFSYFSPNPVTGSFSAEIRSGLKLGNGSLTPIKGGSVSGVMAEALRQMFLSASTLQRGGYMGPKYVRFNNLTIAGE